MITEVYSDLTTSTKAVIIGSGAGGATCAHHLSEAGIDNIVVEEGDFYNTSNYTNKISDMLGRVYRDAGLTPIFGNPNIIFGDGCCVGGSTVINGGLCWRTPSVLLDKWSTTYGLPLLEEKYNSNIL